MCPFQAKVPSPVKRSYVWVLIFFFFLISEGTIFTNTSDCAGALKCLTYGSWWTNTDFFFPSPSSCFFTYKIWTYSVSYSNYKIPSVFWNNLQSKKKKKKGHLWFSASLRDGHIPSLGFFRNCSFVFFILRQCFYFINVYTFGKKLTVVHSSAPSAKVGYLLCKNLPYWEQILDVLVRKGNCHCFLSSLIII